MLGFGLSSALKYIGLVKPFNFLIFPLLAFAVLFLGKKFITIPRIGFVKFGEKRKRDQKILFILGLLTFIIVTTIFVLFKFSSFGFIGENSNAPIGYAFFFIVTINIIAYFLQFKRLFVYSILFGISIPFSELLYKIVGEPLDNIIAFSLTSLPILIVGCVLFFKFIRNYDKNIMEE